MPQPLSQEQLDYFAVECESSFKRGARYATKRATLGYAILLIGVFGMYQNGQNVSSNEQGAIVAAANASRTAIVESGTALSVEGCNRDYNAVGRLRGLLQRSQMLTEKAIKDGDVNPRQAKQARDFYAAELAKLPLPDCRKVAVALTDDPNRPIVTPKPLHPPPSDATTGGKGVR